MSYGVGDFSHRPLPLPVARIAERANIGKPKARAAIGLAASLGVITIEEMPGGKRVIINRGISSRC